MLSRATHLRLQPDVAAAHPDKAQAEPKPPQSDDAVKVEASKAAQPKKAEYRLPLNGASSAQGQAWSVRCHACLDICPVQSWYAQLQA